MSTSKSNWAKAASALLLLGFAALLGCTQAHYRRAADNEVYRIVQSAVQQVFGRTNHFAVKTRDSDRKPTEIPSSEIIADRQQAGSRLLRLQDALSLAVTNSRQYQLEQENLYLAALTL